MSFMTTPALFDSRDPTYPLLSIRLFFSLYLSPNFIHCLQIGHISLSKDTFILIWFGILQYQDSGTI